MESIKHISAVLIATAIILGGQIQAQADWSGAGMHPMGTPGVMPNPGQPAHHEAPAARVEPQHREQPARPVVHQVKPVEVVTPKITRRTTIQTIKQHAAIMPDYFRRDIQYYGHVRVPFPYTDVDTGFTVPDGFETVMVNGETFYYNQGVFYQEVDDQLTAIPAVLGAVVDNIPQDYQIVMADGDHYLVTGGVYYQRVDQGFQVVQPPASDLE